MCVRVLVCVCVRGVCAALRAVVFDMDGTLTQEGALDYAEMYRWDSGSVCVCVCVRACVCVCCLLKSMPPVCPHIGTDEDRYISGKQTRRSVSCSVSICTVVLL
jgi:hypothetical protein